MSANSILYLSSFQQIYLHFCFKSYTFIFWFFSSDFLQVLMFVCAYVSEPRFYGCCLSCLFIFFSDVCQKFSLLGIILLWLFTTIFVQQWGKVLVVMGNMVFKRIWHYSNIFNKSQRNTQDLLFYQTVPWISLKTW